MEKIKQLILDRPGLVAALVLFAVFAFAPGILSIEIYDDLKAGFPNESPIQQARFHLEDEFGSSDTLIVSVATKDESSIYTMERLKLILDLTEAFERVKGVARVQSLANVDVVSREDGSMFTHPLIEWGPESPEEVAAIQHNAHKDPMLSSAFVAKNKDAFAIYVDQRKGSEDKALLEGVRAILGEKISDGYRVAFSGMTVLRDETNTAIQRDMRTLMPGVFIVLALILFWSLRSMHGLLITLMVVGLSLVPPAGLLGYLGLKLTAANNMFPILILGTACADSIHVLSMLYLSMRQGKSRQEAVRRILDELWLPVFLTSVTTAIGFLTLVSSAVPAIRSLGVLVAVGVFTAWILSTVLLPALLLLLPVPTKHEESDHALERRVLPIVEALANKYAVPVGSAILLVSLGLGAVFIPQVKLEPRFETQFPADHQVRMDYMEFDRNYGGSTPIEFVVHADPRDPDLLKAVYALEKDLATIPEVGSTSSVAQMVARAHETIRNEGIQYRSIPDTREQVAQVMFMAAGNPDNFEKFVNRDYSSFRVTIRIESTPVDVLREIIAKVDGYVAEHIPADVRIERTGKALFDLELSELMASSALNTILLSILLVLIICWLFLRSFSDGFMGMVPIVFAVAGNFTVMGMFGIGLSTATSLLSSIVIGVGVDYAIHFLTRWRHEYKLMMHDPYVAIHDKYQKILHLTLEESGPPILFNALAVACGLGVMLGSSFLPIQYLGLLAIVSMASTSAAAIVIIPILKKLFFRDKQSA